eukprot:TRINITY_DN10335_c0_g1_i1.p1 TRINITY_DN10335_c0_g1~~TRINITY_DN10335_c0_g1_i1.p1  ORF type:complete len:222 (+),score=41.90 TRINITY_DN10335_c0_g1_i1:43-708(+)
MYTDDIDDLLSSLEGNDKNVNSKRYDSSVDDYLQVDASQISELSSEDLDLLSEILQHQDLGQPNKPSPTQTYKQPSNQTYKQQPSQISTQKFTTPPSHYHEPVKPVSQAPVYAPAAKKGPPMIWKRKYTCKSCKKELLINFEDLKKYSWGNEKGHTPMIDWFFQCPKCPNQIVVIATATLDCINSIMIGCLPGKIANAVPYTQPSKDWNRQEVKKGDLRPA